MAFKNCFYFAKFLFSTEMWCPGEGGDIEMKKGMGIMEDLEEKLIMQSEMEKEL